jgi:alpha-L-fucosidase
MNPESLSHPYLVSECAFPLLGKERWFYTKPEWDQEVLPVDTLLEIHAEAERFNSLVNISVGPDRAGRLRAVDRQVLLELGARQKVPPLDVPYEMTNQHFLKAPRA